MVFAPKRENPDKWKRDPSLPQIPYEEDGRLNMTKLVNDIIGVLPTTIFKDNVHFEKVTAALLERVWPNWEKYYMPTKGKILLKDVQKFVQKRASINFGG